MSEHKKAWLTAKEAAQLAGVSDARIRQLCIRGKIVCRKFAYVWQVDAESLELWMKRRA